MVLLTQERILIASSFQVDKSKAKVNHDTWQAKMTVAKHAQTTVCKKSKVLLYSQLTINSWC